MSGEEARLVERGQIWKDLVCHARECQLHPEGPRKSMEDFKWEGDITVSSHKVTRS